MLNSLSLARALVVIVALAASASGGIVNPADYASRSGEYALHVESSHRIGGVGTYTLTRGGREVRTTQLPYTLTEVAVADDGMFVGCVETTRERAGILLVARVSAAGELELEHTTAQTYHVPHGPSQPLGKAIFLQPDLERFVVLVDEGPEETLWIFGLTGDEAPEVVRHEQRLGVRRGRSALAGGGVPGTPLTLIQWYLNESPERGTRFALFDDAWAEVWRLELPGDYTGLEGRELWDLWDTGSILATGQSSFEMRLHRDSLRQEFLVREDADAATGWTVERGKLRPYLPPAGALIPPVIEDLQLEHLGSVQLGSQPDPQESSVRNIREFGVGRDGGFSFVRWEEPSGPESRDTLVTLDASGAVLREQQFDELLPGEGSSLSWTFLAQGVYLVTTPRGEDQPLRSWTVDAATGLVASLPDLPARFGEAVGTADGGFVGLIGGDEIVRYSRAGTLLWRREGVPRELPEIDAYWIDFKSLAVTSEGRLAVLEFASRQVLVFELDGTFSHAFALAEAVPQKLRYPTGLKADLDGGLLLDDSQGTPPIWRISIDGVARGSLSPRFPDGRAPMGLLWFMQFDSDRRLWTSDRTALLQLDTEGVVERIVGSSPGVGRIDSPGFAFVDPLGRILVQDSRSGCVHVFDSSGQQLMICEPAPGDFENHRQRFTVSGDGSVYMQAFVTGRVIEFAPDGSRIGLREFGSGELVFKHGSRDYWHEVRLEVALELVDSEGRTRARIDRLPDRRWLPGSPEFALAPDGSVALLVGFPGPWSRDAERTLVLCAANGTPERAVPLPDDVFPYWIAHNGRWIALEADAGPGYLFDVAHGTLHRIGLSGEHADLSGSTGFSPDGREIWWIDGTRLDRFALPAE